MVGILSPTITILFGEMGSGKNYWGEIFMRTTPACFFDGDTVATPEMIARFSKFKSLSEEIIMNYLYKLTDEITARANVVGNLIVAQALYRDEHRCLLELFLKQQGVNVRFVWVKTSFWRNLKQLYSRPKGLRWILYWLMNKPFFQKPTHAYSEVW